MPMRTYALVTASYWAFTISDGALRMLVLLAFHDLGYAAITIAMLFLLYEFMGVLTNLFGGWLGARAGLQHTLRVGLALQVIALAGLTLHDPNWPTWLSVCAVMGLQALSGVAKDLTKMSAKSAVKFVAEQGGLFRLVALLTGSKNALKGVGFFVGAVLLDSAGYDAALWTLAALVAAALVAVLALLRGDIGRAGSPPSFGDLLSKSAALNRLSTARLTLFGARDIWFVVALPVFLDDRFGWSFRQIGGFLAAWVIGYGIAQSMAPAVVARSSDETSAARLWTCLLCVVSAVIALAVSFDVGVEPAVVGGLVVFGLVFAVNSSLHSFLILAYSRSDDEVALDVGFYYAANAAGRLLGTFLSGVLYVIGGLAAAMWGATAFLLATWLLTTRLPRLNETQLSTSLQSHAGTDHRAGADSRRAPDAR